MIELILISVIAVSSISLAVVLFLAFNEGLLKRILPIILAIALHEIPQEIGDFGILIYGGLAKLKALIFNFFSVITAIIGALIVYFFSISSESTAFLLPIAAGGFIYIACVALFPELHKNNLPSVSLPRHCNTHWNRIDVYA